MIQFCSIRGLSMVWLALSFAGSHAAALPENDDVVGQTSIVRTVVVSCFPLDAGMRGNEAAIAESAGRGFALFNGKAACARCHTGGDFTDNRFREVGTCSIDIGRRALEPDNAFAHYAFKPPTLHARRAPYTHDGSFATLNAVMAQDLKGGIAKSSRSKLLKPINLDEQKVADAIEFQKSLTGSKQVIVLPALPN
jgi:cytochrome c peroxidase